MMMEKPMVWSIKVGSYQAGICERKFRQLVLQGAIASVRIGRRRLVTPEAITEYLKKNTVPAINLENEARKILTNKRIHSIQQKILKPRSRLSE